MEDSTSQSLLIYDGESQSALYSFNGYGHDNSVFYEHICLKSKRYTIVAQDGLRSAWPLDSYFSIFAGDVVELFRGTCDFNGKREYPFYPSIVIADNSNWLFADDVESSSWTLPDYDDSSWSLKHYGEFPPYDGRRFYRIHVAVNTDALGSSGAVLFGLRGRNDSSLYINGQPVYEHLATVVEEDAVNHTKTEYFQYTVPAHRLSASLVVAVQTDCAVGESVNDVFDMMAVLLPPHASRLLDGVARSAHAKDFYSNPLDLALDGNRQSLWMIAGSRADFAFTFNRGRFEYLNEYAITVGQNDDKHPVSWVVRGCVGVREGGKIYEDGGKAYEDGDTQCDVLDVRQDETWLGSYQTRVFAMNGFARSYRTYRIDFESGAQQLMVNEIAMGCSVGTTPATLAYPRASLEGIVHLPLAIAPVANVFDAFSIAPALPKGFSLHPATGVLSGTATQPVSRTEFTISALHRALRQLANTTLTLSVVACAESSRLVRLQWTSVLHSQLEWWELRSDEAVVATRRGIDVGEDAVVQSEVFCLPHGNYTLHQRVTPSQAATRAGHLTLQLHAPFPDTDNAYDGAYDFHTLAILPFAECGEAWSVPATTPFTARCDAFPFTTQLLLTPATQWHVNTDDYVDKRWFSTYYDETPSWFLSPTSPLPPFRTEARFRLWLQMDDAAESYDLLLGGVPRASSPASSSCASSSSPASSSRMSSSPRASPRVSLFINGYRIAVKEPRQSDRWLSYRLGAELFHPGANLIALAFAPCDCTLAILLQPVRARAASLTYKSLAFSTSSPPISAFPPQALFDGNWLSEWRGVIANGYLQLTVELAPTLLLHLTEYCFVASSATVDYDPASWSLKGKLTSGRWATLSSVSDVRFFQRGEKRCFPVFFDGAPLVSVLQFSFSSHWREGFIQLSEILLHCVALTRAPLPPFAYPASALTVVRNVELARFDTPCAFYSYYFIEPSLPWGLSLDGGNGQVFGKVDKVLKDTTFTVHAMSSAGGVSTTITLQFRECDAPMSLLHMQLFDLDTTAMLSFRLDSPSSTIASQPVSVYPSSQDFFYCVSSGAYSLLFHDRRNAGFLDTHFALEVDGVLVHAGYFNPGFSNLHVDFTAGFLLARQSLWYYSLDGGVPPAQWYSSIDPVHEAWEVDTPGSFPAPRARAQYFKTVIDVAAFPVDLATQAAFIVEVFVKGGVCVYLHGLEVLRHRLPSGVLTPETAPTASFPQARSVFGSLSAQFADWSGDVVVVAAEVHDAEVQKASEFWMSIHLVPDGSQCEFEARVTSNVEEQITDLGAVFDSRYYDKMVVHDECEDVQLFFDLHAVSYQYVTEVCLFTGNTAGEYPHSLVLDGGVDAPDGGSVAWEPLFSEEEIWFPKVAYGVSQCFHFYNEKSFAHFRLRLHDCEHKDAMEVAEVEFFARRLDGFCEDAAIGQHAPRDQHDQLDQLDQHDQHDQHTQHDELAQRARTPSGEWKRYDCPELYWGRLLRYCENGTWSQEVDYCRPVSPTAFKYPAPMFMVRRKQFVSIVPTVVGAELLFVISEVPKGMHFDSATGELSGFYQEERVMMSVEVRVMNPSGMQEATFALYVVNHHEDLLLVIAVLAIACLVLLVVYIIILMRRSTESVEQKAELSHLHTKELPKNMLPLLV